MNRERICTHCRHWDARMLHPTTGECLSAKARRDARRETGAQTVTMMITWHDDSCEHFSHAEADQPKRP